MDDDKMAIWTAATTPDKEYLKPFVRKGQGKGTDINPTWRAMRMTEMFGPHGKGWGFDIQKTWREQMGEADCVFCQAVVWWLGKDGKRYDTGPQIGGTVVEPDRSQDEAYKMSVTDAIGKCMSYLGVAADVYLGRFDGSKYSKYHDQKTPTAAAPSATMAVDENKKAAAAFRRSIAQSTTEAEVEKWMAEAKTALPGDLAGDVEQAGMMRKRWLNQQQAF